jgi:DNA polymerase I-like protein with 3'-5' exonuclease and polymerase domains
VTEQQRILREALSKGADPHLAWAAHIFDKPVSEVTQDERRIAKSQNFFLLYNDTFLKTVPFTKHR